MTDEKRLSVRTLFTVVDRTTGSYILSSNYVHTVFMLVIEASQSTHVFADRPNKLDLPVLDVGQNGNSCMRD